MGLSIDPAPVKAKKDITSMKNKTYLISIFVLLQALFVVGVFGQNGPKITSVVLSSQEVFALCALGNGPVANTNCAEEPPVVEVRVNVVTHDGSPATLDKIVSGGRITGDTGTGTFSWDLKGLAPGTYTITVVARKTVDSPTDSKTATVTVGPCKCERPPDACPVGTVSGPSGLTQRGEPMTFTANFTGIDQTAVSYNWVTSIGTISSGQGTPAITVETSGVDGGATITVTLTLSGVPDFCESSWSESSSIFEDPKARLFDEYRFWKDVRSVSFDGFLVAEDLWARTDSYFNELNNNPSDQGVVIVYGPSAASIAKLERAVRNYIKWRRIDPARITIINGGNEMRPIVQQWLVPPGAETPSPVVDHSKDIQPLLVDEYAAIPSGETKARLDNFFIEIANHPTERSEIHIYAPTLARFRALERTIKSHMSMKKIDASRFEIIHLKPGPVLVRFWRIPKNAEPPLRTRKMP